MRDEAPTRVHCRVIGGIQQQLEICCRVYHCEILVDWRTCGGSNAKFSQEERYAVPKPHEFVPLGLSSRDVKDLYPAVEPLIMKRPQFE